MPDSNRHKAESNAVAANAGEQADHRFMGLALRTAAAAAGRGEVPVGAVVVYEGVPIVAAGNAREAAADPTGHAEIIALRRAGELLDRWRLWGCTLYVTLEPCPMCAGAVVNARVDRLVYGAVDAKAGAVESVYQLVDDPRLNHRAEVCSGVRRDECARQLKQFFKSRRKGLKGPVDVDAPWDEPLPWLL
ncbi:MAG: tRNA adenosine(34) deaminase TadA [Myxococcota bacterium]